MKKWRVLSLLSILPVLLLCLGCSLAGQHSGPKNTLALKSLENLRAQSDKPQSATTEPYRFIAFGDWGSGTQFQKDTAQQMALQYTKAPFDAALTLGDNIYEVGNVTKLGKAYFTDMYAPLLQHQVHFIVALGNHDVVMGHGDSQVAFFKMPGYYYVTHKPNLDLFAINSNTFAKDAVQQQWLKKALAASHAPWKIVFGHHPIYSSGEHGSNPEMRKTLEPILVQNHVDLYLAGHDHDYERFKPIEGVQHIVSGGGGAYLRGFDKILPTSLVRVKANHFLSFELEPGSLRMTVIDKTGQVIDQAEWHKAQRQNLQIEG